MHRCVVRDTQGKSILQHSAAPDVLVLGGTWGMGHFGTPYFVLAGDDRRRGRGGLLGGRPQGDTADA